ncbi:MAG: sigma-70 family RNA polymerase sigma factor [Verrucomicrobiota bacterium]
MDDHDHQLLRNYAASRDEASFRGLVDRYLDMVYHTALRKTRNPTLAEEVAQQVFTILARKTTGLRAGNGIGGWLHRTTILEAMKALRVEGQRVRKMKELSKHQQNEANEDSSQWNEALPALDEAIEELQASDRQALSLRFFDGLSFRVIGEAMGKSEDASQKQVSRAVEKLSALLRRQGFAVPCGAALAVLLASEAAKAAPTGLSLSVSKGAIAAAPSIAASTLIGNTLLTMAYTKTKVALALVAVSLIPIGLQWKRIHKLEDHVATLSTQQGELAAQGENVAEQGKQPFLSKQESVLARANPQTEGKSSEADPARCN